MDGISLFDGVDVDVLGCVCVKLGRGGGAVLGTAISLLY